MHTIRNAMAVTLVSALVACSEAPEDTSPDHATSTGSVADEQISVTSVVQNPDGTTTVKETTITQAQFQAMKDVRTGQTPAAPAVSAAPGPEGVGTAAQAINADPGCGVDSLWMFNGFGCGGNHMLCLTNPGGISLGTFGWSGVYGPWSVMSYWPGYEGGDLTAYKAGPPSAFTQTSFGAWAPCTDTSSAAIFAQGYYWVNLY